MKILLLLGHNDEYLTYKIFKTDTELDAFVESIQELVLANISGKLPLRKRLQLCPGGEYFPFAGSVLGFEVIDVGGDQ